jgi:hypothetical protein
MWNAKYFTSLRAQTTRPFGVPGAKVSHMHACLDVQLPISRRSCIFRMHSFYFPSQELSLATTLTRLIFCTARTRSVHFYGSTSTG